MGKNCREFSVAKLAFQLPKNRIQVLSYKINEQCCQSTVLCLTTHLWFGKYRGTQTWMSLHSRYISAIRRV